MMRDCDPTGRPVTTQVTRNVPLAKVAPFEVLLHDAIAAARTFHGHLGVDVLRPESGGIYHIIFRFRGHAEHQAWMNSESRRRLIVQIDTLLDDTGAPPEP